jgi:hypothetical protein
VLFKRFWTYWLFALPLPLLIPQYLGFHHVLLYVLFVEGYSLGYTVTPWIEKNWPPKEKGRLDPMVLFSRKDEVEPDRKEPSFRNE